MLDERDSRLRIGPSSWKRCRLLYRISGRLSSEIAPLTSRPSAIMRLLVVVALAAAPHVSAASWTDSLPTVDPTWLPVPEEDLENTEDLEETGPSLGAG